MTAAPFMGLTFKKTGIFSFLSIGTFSSFLLHHRDPPGPALSQLLPYPSGPWDTGCPPLSLWSCKKFREAASDPSGYLDPKASSHFPPPPHTVALATLPRRTFSNSCLLDRPPRHSVGPREAPYLLERCSNAPLARRLRWPRHICLYLGGL